LILNRFHGQLIPHDTGLALHFGFSVAKSRFLKKIKIGAADLPGEFSNRHLLHEL